jgi:predicted Zn-dependent protease with MMP-like domain
MWRGMTGRQTLAPSTHDIERLAQAAIERLPGQFRRHLADVLLRVEDFPDEEVMAAMELETEWDILGLYQGVPLGEKSATASGATPDIIFLYRRPMLDYWADGEDSLEALVTHVLVHEVGHHFGLSDADMERIESEANG